MLHQPLPFVIDGKQSKPDRFVHAIAQLDFRSGARTVRPHLVHTKFREKSTPLAFSTPSRATSGKNRRRNVASELRRFLPEFLALAGALILAAVLGYSLKGAWLAAGAIGFAVAGAALVMFRLTVRSAEDAREADSATLRMRRLYELTRRTLEMDLHEEPGARLALLVQEIFELDAAAVFDADLQEVYSAGRWTLDPSELVQNVYHFGTSDDDRSTGISRRVIRLGSVPIGSIVLRGETTPLANNAIAALIAITFDRYRSLANESRIEAEREAEQLRTTVLDGLAHDFKTPLTAIRAASTGLSEMGGLSRAQVDLVSLIDEQATLLADLTTRLLTTARPDSDGAAESPAGIVLHTAPEPVDSLIEEAVESLADRSAAARIEIELPKEPLVLDCDRRLLGMLLAQYLDNACKYAEFDSTITVRAEMAGEEILFSVHSFGPVIPMADRERIFDRYFRSSASAGNATGTGIGLSIAKRTALAHGGSVWVSSDEAEGTTFFAALPARTSTVSHPHPAHHPTGEKLHPTDEDLPMGTPALERSIS